MCFIDKFKRFIKFTMFDKHANVTAKLVRWCDFKKYLVLQNLGSWSIHVRLEKGQRKEEMKEERVFNHRQGPVAYRSWRYIRGEMYFVENYYGYFICK